MFRTRRVCGNERQIDVRRSHGAEFDFGFFRRFNETLRAHLVMRKVNAVGFAEFGDHPIHDFLVEVVAAEVRVAACRFDFKGAFAEFQNRNVEGAAAEVENQNRFVFVFVETVSKSRRRRFVDDAQNFKSRDCAGVFGRLTLGVVEVSGHGDDCLRDGFAEIFFRVAFEFLQNHRGNFLRRVVFAVDCDFVTFAHVTFNRRNCTRGIADCLTFGKLPDEALTVFGEADDGRGDSTAFGVRDNCGFAAFDDANDAVGCAQIYTDDFTHNELSPLVCCALTLLSLCGQRK